MNRIALSLIVLLVTASFVRAQEAKPAPPPKQEADVAAPKFDAKTGQMQDRFKELHEDFVAQARKGDVDLLFLGDSITEGWKKQPEVWKEHFGQYKTANFGIGGDRTQHVLWRIENGELDGIKPKLTVLMIGTNNSASDPAEKIASGVEKIVKELRAKTGGKVLLLAIFPRGADPKDEKVAKQRGVIDAVNAQIKKLDDGKNVRYLDIASSFLEPDGTLKKEIMPDYLHLSKEGYERWAKAIDQPVKEMMGDSSGK
jgi:lysophospholipase L1-like esterase